MRFQLRDARMAFPNIFTPFKGSFGARLIIPPNHIQTIRASDRKTLIEAGIKLPTDPKAKVKTIPLLTAIAKAVARGEWEGKADAIFKALDAQDKLFYHDGATKAEYEGFEGNIFVAANNKVKPSTWDQNRNEVDEASGVLYSGCFVVASLDIWAQDHKEYGKRINAGLRGVQKLRDGDAFSGGGAPADEDEFDDELGVDGDEPADEPEDEDETDLTA